MNLVNIIKNIITNIKFIFYLRKVNVNGLIVEKNLLRKIGNYTTDCRYDIIYRTLLNVLN